MTQRDKRNYKFTDKKYDYSWSRLIICEGTPENPEKIVKNGAKTDYDADNTNDINLEFDKQYFAWCEIDWIQTYQNDFNLNCYSKHRVIFAKNSQEPELDRRLEILTTLFKND